MCTLEEMSDVATTVVADVEKRVAKGERGYIGGTEILADALCAMRLKCETCTGKRARDLEPNALKRTFLCSLVASNETQWQSGLTRFAVGTKIMQEDELRKSQ
jgi:hypothetical protein